MYDVNVLMIMCQCLNFLLKIVNSIYFHEGKQQFLA